jgi:uncharacterized protein DUF3309
VVCRPQLQSWEKCRLKELFLKEDDVMPLGTILLIILVILLIGAIPSWPYSAAWGPFPAGILGVVLIVVLILVLTGRV